MNSPRPTTRTSSVTTSLRLLLALCIALAGVIVAPLRAFAEPLTAPFTDDDFSMVASRSDNMGAYTSTDSAFAADPSVITRTDDQPGWMQWDVAADLTSVSVDSYMWVHGTNQRLVVQTSADGATWTPLPGVSVVQRTNEAGADWPFTTHEARVTEPGQRHLRVELTGSAEGGGWGIQVSRVHVNSRVLMVSATPKAPARIGGPTDITLATPSQNATIRYTLNGGAEKTYSGPIRITDKTRIVAVASSPGLISSVPATFDYSTSAEVTVDRYGQVAAADFPGKVTSDEQLRADVAADKAWYGSLKPPARDPYGGDPGSGARLGLDATGWFHLGTTSDGRKTLVTPDGNQYFSLGLNGFGSVGDTYTQVSGREELYEYLPSDPADPLNAGWMGNSRQNYSFYVANQVRKYGSWNPDADWSRQVERASQLCFNGAGGFSNIGLRSNAPYPYVAHLDDVPNHPIGDSGLYDVYAPGLQQELNEAMARNVAAYKNDRHLIGYMFFNEIFWTRLRTAVSESKASEVASKGVLVDMLQKRHGTIASFNAAWGMDAASFDALKEMPFAPRTDAAVADIDAFSEAFLDTFYEVFSTAIRKADPHHLVMGDRWFGNVIANDKLRDQLATAAGKHLDVITYNYYTWDLNQSRIDAIWEKSGHTPMILTEFHYGEPTHGLTFAIRMGANEDEKGLLYRNYVEKAAASGGKIVGAHWFEYLDQAATGRWYQGYDGEAGGIGIIDVADRPYKVLQQHMAQSNCAIYNLAEGRQKPYQYAFKPGQTERDNSKTTKVPKAAAPLQMDGKLDQWPAGETLHLGAVDLVDGVMQDGVEGKFRLGWDEEFLYLHAAITDPTPMLNPNKGFDIWNGDAIELFVGPRNVDQGGGIQVADTQIILSAQPQDSDGRITYYWYNERSDQPRITGVVKPADGGYTLEARIRLADLHIDKVNPPQTMRFDIGFDDGNGRQRQRQFMWNGVEGNSQNREAWGRAVLQPAGDAPRPTPSVTPPATPTPTPTPSTVTPTPGKPGLPNTGR